MISTFVNGILWLLFFIYWLIILFQILYAKLEMLFYVVKNELTWVFTGKIILFSPVKLDKKVQGTRY